VHIRRAILLFALVLGLTAVAASLAPTPRESRNQTPSKVPPPPPAPAGQGITVVKLRAPATAKPPEPQVKTGTHVVIAVSSSQAGQAAIPTLGRIASVGAYSPARFDLNAPAPGRYPVWFTAPGGEAQQVGTLVSR
jgi:hypothetical protein